MILGFPQISQHHPRPARHRIVICAGQSVNLGAQSCGPQFGGEVAVAAKFTLPLAPYRIEQNIADALSPSLREIGAFQMPEKCFLEIARTKIHGVSLKECENEILCFGIVRKIAG